MCLPPFTSIPINGGIWNPCWMVLCGASSLSLFQQQLHWCCFLLSCRTCQLYHLPHCSQHNSDHLSISISGDKLFPDCQILALIGTLNPSYHEYTSSHLIFCKDPITFCYFLCLCHICFQGEAHHSGRSKRGGNLDSILLWLMKPSLTFPGIFTKYKMWKIVELLLVFI